MINFDDLCNSAFANEMAGGAVAIHLFANRAEGAPIHWRVNDENDIKAYSGQWVRLMFVYPDGYTNAEDAYIY